MSKAKSTQAQHQAAHDQLSQYMTKLNSDYADKKTSFDNLTNTFNQTTAKNEGYLASKNEAEANLNQKKDTLQQYYNQQLDSHNQGVVDFNSSIDAGSGEGFNKASEKHYSQFADGRGVDIGSKNYMISHLTNADGTAKLTDHTGIVLDDKYKYVGAHMNDGQGREFTSTNGCLSICR